MNKLGYAAVSLLGVVGVIAGILIVVYSMDEENVYWLIFGLAMAAGSRRELRELEARADAREEASWGHR